MQEAFLKVWEHWSHVRVMENPSGYLYLTARSPRIASGSPPPASST
jgi:hypothetical protein